jgi:Kazal-type serine protease inhibitor domain
MRWISRPRLRPWRILPAPAGTCFIPDMQGTCAKVPGICSMIYLPVCGCNGKTYANACLRMHAKVSKAHDGKCWETK